MKNLIENVKERIKYPNLYSKITDARQAASLILDGMTVAVSGFTPSGCPKVVTNALAEQVKSGERQLEISLLSGASTGPEIDDALSGLNIIKRRSPYITSPGMRADISKGNTSYLDMHLGSMAESLRYGHFGKLDIAIIEACYIDEEDGIIPTTAVGSSNTFCEEAETVILELNVNQPLDLIGIHDLYKVDDPPLRKPIPLISPEQRIGRASIHIPPDKIVAIVPSDAKEKPRAFTAPDEKSIAIASHIVNLLKSEKDAGRISAHNAPLQSGVGSVANAVLDGLKDSDFTHIKFFSEVMQDSILTLFDLGKADFCSATSLSLSEEGMKKLFSDFDSYRNKIILRNSEVSNNPEVIRRLGVIAMNTAIEVDIYGNVNSSHMMGTDMYNGIGGSCDFARGAALTIFMTNSTAKDGNISSIVPMVSHVDHSEHDVDIIVTEQGLADLRGLSPKERAIAIMENCAHHDYKEKLMEYYNHAIKLSGPCHTPHDLTRCFSFHQKFLETGSMK